ncbi:MAG: HesA/MoeB/ThiF family protein [Deltaproteobacteria bacterium]|nr:HesA/MoeB/ThiF family protein [Deltaproteobacteria bacterium]
MTSPSSDLAHHSRHLPLPFFGASGVEKLSVASVAVVGCGGLGAPILQALAGAGVGKLRLFDDDVVEASNLNRQFLFGRVDIGQSKAEQAKAWVNALLPSVDVDARRERVSPAFAASQLAGVDLVIDATDGLPNKYLLNDVCVADNVPLIHGAVTSTTGQILVVPGAGGPCLRCLFPTIPAADAVPSCQEAGVLGASCGVVGHAMGAEAIKWLLGMNEQCLVGKLLSIDVFTHRYQALPFPKKATCPACGTGECDGSDPDDYVASCTL